MPSGCGDPSGHGHGLGPGQGVGIRLEILPLPTCLTHRAATAEQVRMLTDHASPAPRRACRQGHSPEARVSKYGGIADSPERHPVFCPSCQAPPGNAWSCRHRTEARTGQNLCPRRCKTEPEPGAHALRVLKMDIARSLLPGLNGTPPSSAEVLGCGSFPRRIVRRPGADDGHPCPAFRRRHGALRPSRQASTPMSPVSG